jgi:S-adenosylmethionine-diacylgycerolhomoserine-N-methlytransferase
MPDARDAMDRMYCLQRHFYDATRKHYLLGRDTLIERMDVRAGDRVAEIGCGTARNLVLLAQRHPAVRLYGLDASNAMLKTAHANLSRAQLDGRVILCQGLAEELDYTRTFLLDKPLDVIYFSYALSMIPTWEAALEAAFANLAPGRALYIVDFWDQAELPAPFRAALKKWLELFGVHHRPELMARLDQWAEEGRCRLAVKSLHGRYAYIAAVFKPKDSDLSLEKEKRIEEESIATVDIN